MAFLTREMATEARRNVAQSPARGAILGAIVAVVVLAVVLAELRTVGNLIDFHRLTVAAGTNVLVVESPGGQIPVDRCVALGGLDGVERSGAVRRGPAVALATAPAVLVQTAIVTIGAVQLWADRPLVAPTSGGLFAGAELGAELRWRPRASVQLAGDAPTQVVDVVDLSRRAPSANRWLLSIGPPTGLGDECWIEFEDGVDPAAGTAMADATFAATPDAIPRPLLRANALAHDAMADLRDRPSAHAWLAGGALLGLVQALLARTRRSEAGVYRVHGARAADLMLLSIIEGTLILLPAALLGALWSIATDTALLSRALTGAEVELALSTASKVTALGVALGSPAWALLGRGSLAVQLRDP
jgi:hypothetical protein